MGYAAYARGNALISRQIRADLDSFRNTLENRARLWKTAMEAGMVLVFRAANGDTVTCGPYQTAVPGAVRFAAFRYNFKGREIADFTGQLAWSVALWVVEHCGRRRPLNLEED